MSAAVRLPVPATGRRPLPPRAAGLTVGASAAGAAGLLLPWASSGRRVRSGLDLARLADSLGLVSSWPGRALLVGVAGLPLLAAVAWTAACLRRPGLVAAAGAASGAVAVAGAVVWRAPVQAGIGPVVSVTAGGLALAGAIALVRTGGWTWTTSRG